MLKFLLHETPDMEFNIAIKKPIPIKCKQIHQAFEVESLEGLVKGKPGDWLMVGVDGEKYVCDDRIFKKTYDLQD